MKTFKTYLNEKWYQSVTTVLLSHRKEIDIFKNPSRKELIECSEWDGCAGFLLHDDMYVWKSGLHALVLPEMGLGKNRDVIPLRIDLDGSNIVGVQVSDYAQRTKWDHNPDVYDAIITHRMIDLYGQDIESEYFVSYYDEAIVGSWHENISKT